MADVTLPQLGETVTEGTITRWFKKVGDQVAADEPLFEVSTDKVDTEVPSPISGTLTQILAQEGDTVDVGTVIAVVGDAAGASAEPPAGEPAVAEPAADEPAAAEAPAAAPSASPTTAMTVPTSTVSPSWTRISVSTPETGDGTSVSTLSVDTSNNGSSAATVSPTFLNHWVIVPSVTVSPSCGSVTSAMRGVSSSVWSCRAGVCLAVEVAARERHRGLAEQFRQARMGLEELRDLVDGRFPVDRQVTAAELLGDPGAHHVDAEHLPG